MPDSVIQGTADLNVQPFLTALAKLSQEVDATVAAVSAKIQGLSAVYTQFGGVLAQTAVKSEAATNRIVTATRQAAKSQSDAFIGAKSELRITMKEWAAATDARAAGLIKSQKAVETAETSMTKTIEQAGVARNLADKRAWDEQLKNTVAQQEAVKSGLRKSEAALTASEAAMTKTVEKAAVARNTAESKAWSQQLKDAKAQQDALKAGLTKSQSEMARAQAAMTATQEKTAAARNAADMRAWDAQLATAVRARQAQEKAAAETAKTARTIGSALAPWQKALKEIEDAWNSIYRAGAQISQTSMTIAVFGAAITGVVGLSIKAAAGFDFWTRRFVAAAQAAGSATLQISGIKSLFEEVSFITGTSAENVAEAASRFEQAMGIELRSMKDVSGVARILEVVLKATTIAKEDAGLAIIGVVQGLGAYGLGMQDAVRVTMAMSNAAQISRAQFGNFVESIKMVGSVAHGLNIDLYESLAVLARLSEVGQIGSQAGRGLQRFLAGMIDPSKEAAEAWAAVLGDAWRDVVFPGGKFLGLIDKINESGEQQVGLIGRLYLATKNYTDAEREQFFAKITTENAYRVISPLIKSYGKDIEQAEEQARTGIKGTTKTLVELNDEFRDSTKQAQLFGAQWDTVAESIEIAWSQQLRELEALFRDIGTAAHEALLPIVRNVMVLVAGIREWTRENSELFRNLVLTTTALGGFLLVLGTMGFLLGQAIQGFAAFNGLILKGGKAITMILGPTIGLAARSFGILGIAVIILANIWRDNWFGMGDALKYVVTMIRDLLVALLQMVGNIVGVVSAAFSGDWAKAWDLFVDIVITAIALISLHAGRAVLNLGNDWFKWGAVLMGLFAAGLVFGGQTAVVAAITGVVLLIAKFLKGFSPPKEGPLREIKEWGENVIGAFGEGVKKAGERKIKPAAKEVAKEMSKPLEGHSPAKEGPLSEIAEWGSNLMDAMLRGFKKADFSVLNEVAQLAVDSLKDAFDGKKMSAGVLISGIHDAKAAVVSLISTIRTGGEVASSVWTKIRSLVGDVSDEVETLINAYSALVEAEKEVEGVEKERDALQERKRTELEIPQQAIRDQIADLEIEKRLYDLQVEVIEDANEQLERSKEPLQDQREAIRDTVEEWEDGVRILQDANKILEDTKSLEEDLILPIREKIKGINDEIDGRREANKEIRDTIDNLRAEKSELDDQIDAVEERYDKERKSAKEAIDGLRDQLDLIKEQNAEKLKPLEETAEGADKTLEEKRKKDKAEEEVLERRIASYRERGASGNFVDKLEAQLRKLRDKHEDEQGLLEDQKDAADDAVDAERERAETQESTLEKQLKDKQRAEDAAEKQRLALIAAETAVASARIKAIEQEEKTLEKRSREIDKEIAAKEKDIKAQENEEKVIQKRIDAIDKDIKENDKEVRIAEQRIAIKEGEDRSLAKREQAIDRQIALNERDVKRIGDDLQRIEREEATLQHQEALLEQGGRTLEREIESNALAIKAAEDKEKAAQTEYDTAKAIIDLYQKDRQDARSAMKSEGDQRKPEGGESGESIAKKLEAELEGLKTKIKQTIGTLSAELELEKYKVREQLTGMFQVPELTFKRLMDKLSWEIFFAIANWTGMWNGFGAFLGEWGENIGRNMGITGESIGNTFGSIGQTVGDTLGTIGETVGTTMGTIGQTIGDGLGNAGKTIGDFLGNTGKSFGDALGGLGRLNEQTFNQIAKFIGDSLGEIGKWWDKFWGTDLPLSLETAKNVYGGYVQGIWDGITETARTWFSNLGKEWDGFWNGLRNTIVGEDGQSGLLGGFKNSVKTLLEGFRDTWNNIWNGLGSAVDNALRPLQSLIDKMGELWDMVGLDAAAQAFGSIISSVLPRRHSGALLSDEELAVLQKGERVLSRTMESRLSNLYGRNWPAALSMGVQSAVSSGMPARVQSGAPITLQIGTLIADERGLTELERRLKRVRDVRSSRVAA